MFHIRAAAFELALLFEQHPRACLVPYVVCPRNTRKNTKDSAHLASGFVPCSGLLVDHDYEQDHEQETNRNFAFFFAGEAVNIPHHLTAVRITRSATRLIVSTLALKKTGDKPNQI